MKYLIYLLAIILLLGLNAGIFSSFQIKGVMPNLLLLFMVLFSLDRGDSETRDNADFLVIAFLSGLFLDFSSTTFFGSFALAFLLISLVLRLSSRHLLVFEMNWKYYSAALAVSLAALSFFIWFYNLLCFRLGWAAYLLDGKVLRSGYLISLVYNLLLLYPMYLFAESVKRGIAYLSVQFRKIK
ncbi:MAG: hypothetical protein M1383_02560 [Patescibacteria group bacterium]|nr:hypothetical protein [Patescibacteria group bacterium]